MAVTKFNLEKWLQTQWQGFSFFTLLLLPFSALFWLIIRARKLCYQFGLLPSMALPVPVIIVGNITVGGTGKTPLVIWLVEALRMQGYKPAVISRGFGANSKTVQEVLSENSAITVGDEPLLFKSKNHEVNVTVGEDRLLAIPLILQQFPGTEVILLDDAFQHRSVTPGLNILLTEFSVCAKRLLKMIVRIDVKKMFFIRLIFLSIIN